MQQSFDMSNNCTTVWLQRLGRNRLWDVGVVIVFVLRLIKLAVMLPSRANDLDFSHYYLASRLLLEGKSVYSTSLAPLYRQYGFVPFQDLSMETNSPPLLWLVSPLALLPPHQAFAIWVILEIGSLCVVFWLIWQLLGSKLSRRGWWFVCATVLASDAVYWHFYTSQVQLLLAATLLTAYALHKAGKHTSACLAVACAGVLKLFPFILLPWFVWRSGATIQGRIRRASIVLGFTTFVVLITGINQWKDFFQLGVPRLSRWALNFFPNHSIPSLVAKLGYTSGFFARSSIEGWWVSVTIGLALIGLIYLVCLRNSPRRDEEIEFCLLSTAMLACAGFNQSHYFVLMIFPIVALCTRVMADPSMARVAWFSLIVLLLNHLGPWGASGLDHHPYLKILANHNGLYGLVMAGVFWGTEWRRHVSA